MVQQYIEQAFLTAVLAVQRGLIGPKRAAEILAEALTTSQEGWLELVSERQLLDQSAAEALQSLVDQQLQACDGDSLEAVKRCVVDAHFRREVSLLGLAELDGILRLTAAGSPEMPSSAETALGDRYATLGSQVASAPITHQDPYTTGASVSSVGDDAAPESLDASRSEGNTHSDTSPAPSEGASALPPSVSTQPEQHVLEAGTNLEVQQPANYASQSAAVPEFQTLDQSTKQPDGDYETLQSGVSNTGASTADAAADANSIPWPLRFRVLREHAKGGLGKVSVAEDLELHREVAFKEIQRRYADDEEARTRFLLEAEITGGLEHPGIVPVYGLGTHADGRPYYAMRFIRGRSMQQAIEHYFQSEKQDADAGTLQLEFRQLLRRFIDMCNAIDYAHNRGIIHRDLKPGNVMLGDYGETLVVDWGIAKAVSVTGSLFKNSLEPLQPMMTGDVSQTVMGVAIGTPQFMSPEQAKGKHDELGPASDVYSLGATLYCLLTGVAAFTSRDLSTVLKQVKEGTFPPPRQVNPKVPKPLDAICVKAMALLPALRYGTARALAEDIEHWLADEPVSAYEENKWERLSRWVRHHQARAQAIGMSVLVIAAVSIIAAFLIDQSRRAEAKALADLKVANLKEIAAHEQEKIAKQEALRRSRDTREAIDTLLTEISNALDEFPGMQVARQRLLERAARDYTRLAAEKSNDPELQLEAMLSLVRLAEVYQKLNSVDKARAAFQQADAIMQKLPSLGGLPLNKVKFEQALLNTKRGLFEAEARDFKKAETSVRDAISALTVLVREAPTDIDYEDALGTAHLGLGRSYQKAGKVLEASMHFQQGMFQFRNMMNQQPKNVRVLTRSAFAASTYGQFLFDTGQPLEAIATYLGAIELQDILIDERPDDADLFAQRAAVRITLAEALRSLGRWPDVVRALESSVTDLAEVVRARPDVPQYRENLAVGRTDLGQALRKLGSNTAAVPVLRKALENFDELAASFPIPRYLEEIGNTRTSLAQVLSELGQQDEALELINTAISDYGELLDLDAKQARYHEDLGIAHSNRGRILIRRGDQPGGLQALEAGIASLKSAVEMDPKTPRVADHLAWAWTHLGQVQFASGQTMPARESFQEALKIRKKLTARYSESPQYRDSLGWLLATCPVEELRDPLESLLLSQAAKDSAQDSTQFWLTYGAAQLLQGERTAAVVPLRKSLELRGQDEGLTLCLLAIAEAKEKQIDSAQKSLASAKAWQQAQKPTDEELAYWIKQAEGAVEKK